MHYALLLKKLLMFQPNETVTKEGMQKTMASTQLNSKSPRVTECSRHREQSVQMAAGRWTTQEGDLMEKKRIHRPHSTIEMLDEFKNMIKRGN